MSLAKVNKRNKLMWDNCFNPISSSDINASTYEEPAAVVGTIEGKKVYRRFLIRTLSEKSITDGYYGFSLVGEGKKCIILSCNVSYIPENAPITSENHPYMVGNYNSYGATVGTNNTIHAYQSSPRGGRVTWGSSVTSIKVGTVLYMDFTYIEVGTNEEPVPSEPVAQVGE